MTLQPRARLAVLLRLRAGWTRPKSTTTVTIGGVTKEVRAASRPELVPSGFLPKEDKDVPPDTRSSACKVGRNEQQNGNSNWMISSPGRLPD